jgi:SPP1 gp7 family putative phage head morphogenesis protein
MDMFVVDARRESSFQRRIWLRVRNTERHYARQLRKVADQVRHIVQAFGTESPEAIAEMQATLHRYADILTPWSRAVARRMLYETARRDERAWRSHAKRIGEEISNELQSADIGGAYQQLLTQQVDLITSLPRDAAIRVQKLATEHLFEGRRFPEISAEIMRSGLVTKARADLIARTETGRAAVTFQQVRAQAIGSEYYIWYAVMDWKTRELHRTLNKTMHRWDDPPIAGPNGERAHPGAIYNCRCYAEPVLPGEY